KAAADFRFGDRESRAAPHRPSRRSGCWWSPGRCRKYDPSTYYSTVLRSASRFVSPRRRAFQSSLDVADQGAKISDPRKNVLQLCCKHRAPILIAGAVVPARIVRGQLLIRLFHQTLKFFAPLADRGDEIGFDRPAGRT